MANTLYSAQNSEYLKKNNTWHVEDSYWKASQIFKLVKRNSLTPKSIVEIGCGAGEILKQLQHLLVEKNVLMEGYDISPDAYELSKTRENANLKFFREDLLEKSNAYFDLCLVIDVFEHVENDIDFVRKCGSKAFHKIYHIPLDLHVSALLRNKLIDARNQVGHIHYYTKETALATISDAGQEILDYFFTHGSLELNKKNLKTKIANLFRRFLFKINPDLAVRLIGGYSLIVLSK